MFGSEAQKQSALEVVRKAVTALHKKGLVHGDLRSSNILICGEYLNSVSVETNPLQVRGLQ